MPNILKKIFLFFTSSKENLKSNSRAFKSISALAGGNLIAALLGAIGGILVARFIGPEENGQFRFFTIPLMYMTFLHAGTFDGLYRQIPFYIGKERQEHVAKLASAAGAWNVYVTILIGTGFTLCSIRGLFHGDWVTSAGWISQAFACVGIYYGGYLSATYRTLDNFVALARIQLLQAVVAFCLIVTVVFWGFYGLCLRAAIPTLFSVWLYHQARPLRIPLTFDLASFKEVVQIGLPLCFWGTLYSSLWMAIEYSLMLHFGGSKAVGLFSVAFIMSHSLSILPQSVHQVIMPRIVESYSRNGCVSNAAKNNFIVTGILTVFMSTVVLLVSFLLNYFVPYFIPKYIDGLILMKVYISGVIIQAASIPLNGLVATGRSWLFGKGILVGLVIFISP